ncbi:MAG: fructose-6-phosphate aldolase [Erysipelotrichales bacterium]|jgi:TalC/MipB family fructose-6-phosphate aldolase|nr:fructose-6-phosphate aldolase [Erysipelotrichales bacterium]
MEIIVDTANLEQIKEACEYFPLAGVTCNPSIVKKSAAPENFYDHVRKMREIIGKDRSLHVQVVGLDSDTQIKEAHRLLEEVDKDVYVKVPVTYEGLKTMKKLKAEGIHVTATAVYDTMQAYYALAAGVDYIALYVNRMTTFGTDPNILIQDVQNKIEREGLDTKLVAAGFHSTGQIREAFNYGCESITAPLDLLKATFTNENINKAIDTFKKDWESMYGEGATLLNL